MLNEGKENCFSGGTRNFIWLFSIDCLRGSHSCFSDSLFIMNQIIPTKGGRPPGPLLICLRVLTVTSKSLVDDHLFICSSVIHKVWLWYQRMVWRSGLKANSSLLVFFLSLLINCPCNSQWFRSGVAEGTR